MGWRRYWRWDVGVLACMLACGVATQSSGQYFNRDVRLKDQPADLGKMPEWWEKIESDRGERITNCMTVVRALKDDPEAQWEHTRLWYAVHLLGEFRGEMAVGTLLDSIDLKMPAMFGSLEAPKDSEVVKSLALIGKPASKGALERLGKETLEARAIKYARVMYLVEGPEVGRFMLENAISKEKDADRKARLQKALELFGHSDQVTP